MEKRGQVYIIAALILIGILYVVLSQSNQFHQDALETDFKKISKNYYIESNKIINSLMNDPKVSQGQIDDEFVKFTTIFTAYSKAQNPQMGLIYIFNYDNSNQVQIGNYLNKTIYLNKNKGNGGKPLAGCYDEISASVEFEGLEISVPINYGDILKNCVTTQSASGKLTIYYNNFPYTFDLKPNKPQLMVVTLQDEKEQQQVFIAQN